MAKNEKLVASITPMSEDFAQWYTDIVKRQSLLNTQALKDVWSSVPMAMLYGKICRRF